jgi:hypothetical protein
MRHFHHAVKRKAKHGKCGHHVLYVTVLLTVQLVHNLDANNQVNIGATAVLHADNREAVIDPNNIPGGPDPPKALIPDADRSIKGDHDN